MTVRRDLCVSWAKEKRGAHLRSTFCPSVGPLVARRLRVFTHGGGRQCCDKFNTHTLSVYLMVQLVSYATAVPGYVRPEVFVIPGELLGAIVGHFFERFQTWLDLLA